MQIDYPYGFDALGRTATTGEEDHIRDMIEQLLFTAPGERVNRPTFGSGLLRLVFAPNSDALAAATELSVKSALQQFLGDRIAVEAVDVEADDAILRITVQYILRSSGERRVAQFTQEAAP
ncbi:MAG TPA: GPW/gp25 family protein [Candidatus Kapabacteria bacterium]|nr:GPW/gp25 family protein [Candidatus Kapabacteria bacterium]